MEPAMTHSDASWLMTGRLPAVILLDGVACQSAKELAVQLERRTKIVGQFMLLRRLFLPLTTL